MKAIKTESLELFGEVCQLQLVPDRDPRAGLTVDHVAPLSSNKLNKELRGLAPLPGRKVVTQSFGSNDRRNLVLACGRCNRHKMNRFLTRDEIKRILSVHQ